MSYKRYRRMVWTELYKDQRVRYVGIVLANHKDGGTTLLQLQREGFLFAAPAAQYYTQAEAQANGLRHWSQGDRPADDHWSSPHGCHDECPACKEERT